MQMLGVKRKHQPRVLRQILILESEARVLRNKKD